jgi:hypothetical protein
MLIKVIIPIIFSPVGLVLAGCSFIKHQNPEVFKIKQAYYQSWVISDNEKGADIVLILNIIKDGVEFDSIVFRGMRLKAFVTGDNKEVSIKGILPSGISRLKLENKVVNLPDQLIYHYKGERKSYFLRMIERKSTRFYKSN